MNFGRTTPRIAIRLFLVTALFIGGFLAPAFAQANDAPAGQTPTGVDTAQTPSADTAPADAVSADAPPLYVPVEEAPTALFQTEIGDAEVSLFLSGFWNAGIDAGTGFGYRIPGDAALSPGWETLSFPDMNQGFALQQIPNLTLSLWLMNKYFFETNVIEGYRFNTYVLGYDGEEDAFVRSVRIGNSGVAIGSYPFLAQPGASSLSPGLMARFHTNFSDHEFMVRFDPSTEQRKIFSGTDEIVTDFLAPGAYVRGRFFALPDAGIENLEVYIETIAGELTGSDGYAYRRIEEGEAIVSLAEGLLLFLEAPAGRIVAFYRKGGSTVGDLALGADALCGVSAGNLDPSAAPIAFSWLLSDYLGENMADRLVTVDGNPGLLLGEPGGFSPFELCNVYAYDGTLPEEAWRTSVYFTNEGNTTPSDDEEIPCLADPGARTITLYPGSDALRDPVNRFPLAGTEPDLYLPGSSTAPGRAILLSVLQPLERYVLEPGIVPDSVRVLRNGVEEEHFTVDLASGEIAFADEVFPGDRIVVTYRTETVEPGRGDLLLAWGNTFNFTESLGAGLAMGLRWNILAGPFSTRAYEYPGSFVTSASFSYDTDNFNAALVAGVSLSTPDSTGVLRLLGMEDEGLALALGEDLRPSSAPASPVGGISCVDATRGVLLFKDFRSYSATGAWSLNNYEWTPPAAQIHPYASGSIPGPYIAAASDIGENVGVMEFTIGAGERWVGAQASMPGANPALDLSQTTSLSLSARLADLTGSVRVFIQIGSIGEDLDGDSFLDAEMSEHERGFEFNAPQATLLIGGSPAGESNGVRDTEDANANALLDPENPDRILTREITVPSAAFGDINIPLSRAERALLNQSRALRFLVVSADGNPCGGRLIFSSPRLTGTVLVQGEGERDRVRFREVAEDRFLLSTAEPLAAAFPEVASVFHASASAQKVLEVAWDQDTETGWTARAFLPQIDLNQYEIVRFYVRTAEFPPGARILFELLDSSGAGLHAALTLPASTVWHEIEISPSALTVLCDGEATAADVSLDAAYGLLNQMVIGVENAQDGLAYFDEFCLRTARTAVGVGATADLRFQVPGAFLSAGSVPILSSFSIRERGQIYSTGFAPANAVPAEALSVLSATEASITLLYIGITGDATLSAASGATAWNTGHRLRLPASGGNISLVDSFRRIENGNGENLSRGTDASLTWPNVLSFSATQRAEWGTGRLSQNWTVGLSALFLPSFRFNPEANVQLVRTSLPPVDGAYFPEWIGAYAYLLPSDDGSFRERRFRASLTTAWDGVPVGFQLQPTVSSSSQTDRLGSQTPGEGGRRQTDTLRIVFALPLGSAGDGLSGWGLTPGYERNLRAIQLLDSAGDLGTDLSQLGSILASQTYWYSAIPFAEFFLPATATLFHDVTPGLLQAEYNALMTLTLSRDYGSFLRDFFLPSQLNLRVGRALTMNRDTYGDSLTTETELTGASINLFGERGAYPLLTFYSSDEFLQTLKLRTRSSDTGLFGEGEFILQNTFTFFRNETDFLNAENRLQWAWAESDTVNNQSVVTYSWQQHPAEGINLPIVSRDLSRLAYFTHNELGRVDIKSEEVGRRGFYLTLSHETILTVPETGFLKLSLSVGGGYETVDGLGGTDRIFLFGLEAGILIQLTF